MEEIRRARVRQGVVPQQGRPRQGRQGLGPRAPRARPLPRARRRLGLRGVDGGGAPLGPPRRPRQGLPRAPLALARGPRLPRQGPPRQGPPRWSPVGPAPAAGLAAARRPAGLRPLVERCALPEARGDTRRPRHSVALPPARGCIGTCTSTVLNALLERSSPPRGGREVKIYKKKKKK